MPRESFPEGSGNTYKKGALVVVDQTGSHKGYLVECGANPLFIMGVATQDGQNTTNDGDKSTIVELAHPDTLFLGCVDTSASEGTGVTAASQRGKMFGVTRTTAAPNQWYVDTNKTSGNNRVIVWNFWLNAQDGVAQAIGDTLGWVVFSFDPQFFQGNKTS